jgi:NADPH2:quinone reductase
MTDKNSDRGLQLRSLVTADGNLEVTLVSVPVEEPKENEVVVRIEATPINPSDLGLLFGMADISTASVSGTTESPVLNASIPDNLMRNMQARVDQSMTVGNEGAGVVVMTGSSEAAQALMGKTVAIVGGGMYTQYRTIKAVECLLLPEDATPVDGASCFVNPLTVLGMVETMRLEGHTGLVHTAAASNLGQMLIKVCVQDKVPLVNIVRKQEHVDLLKSIGATHVCNSNEPSFMTDLIDVLVDTGATLAFDATGGGKLAGQILTCMEAAANKSATEFSRYGSTVHKQAYIYGGLDRTPTTFTRNFGTAWGIGGWLLTPFLQKIGFEAAQKLRERVAAEIKTTFASTYTREVSLPGALQMDAISVYGKQATGEKYLIRPHLV